MGLPIVMVSETGKEHGLINRVANSVKDDDFKNFSPEHKAEMQKRKKNDAKIIKARYVNHQDRISGELTLPYCKYAGDPIETWRFLANNEYTLPFGLIDQVNSADLPMREGKVVNGVPLKKDALPEKIHEFIPVGW